MLALVVLLVVILLVAFLSVISGSYEPVFSAAKLYNKMERMKDFFYSEKLQRFFKNLNEPVKTLYTLDDIPDKLNYSATWFLSPRKEHIGQLKLFLSELQFLTRMVSSITDDFLVIYAGSAPSNKIAFMENLYPNMRWILIDPNEHVLMYPNNKTQYDAPHSKKFLYLKCGRGTGKVHPYYDPEILVSKDDFNNNYFSTNENAESLAALFMEPERKYLIVEDFMSDDLAELLKKIIDQFKSKNISAYFISDIRTNSEGEAPSDLDVLWNSAQQMSWCKIMQPVKAMLKFRTPFWDTADSVKRDADKPMYKSVLGNAKKYCDFISDYESGKFKYFKADVINLQAFAGKSSTETRMITSSYDELVEYNYHDFEDKIFYYNKIYCDLLIHNEHEKYLDKELGIDKCGDCAIMCGIFKAYFDKYGLPDTTLESIKSLMRQIKRGFMEKNSYHGVLYEPYRNVEDVIYIQKRLQNLITYRSLKPAFKQTDITDRNIFIAKEIVKKHDAIQNNDKIPLLDKIRFHMDLLGVYQLIPFFNKKDFMKVCGGIVSQSDKSKEGIIDLLEFISSVVFSTKPIPKYPKSEWGKVYETLTNAHGVEFHKDKVGDFMKLKGIKNIYEIVNFKMVSVFSDFPNFKLGTLYPDTEKGDFYSLDFSNITSNSLVIINIHHVSDFMIFWITDHLKYSKDVAVILIVYRKIYTAITSKTFTNHESIITKHRDCPAHIPSTTSRVNFYTHNISNEELRSMVEWEPAKNHRK